mgnify:CR=1 FL=1
MNAPTNHAHSERMAGPAGRRGRKRNAFRATMGRKTATQFRAQPHNFRGAKIRNPGRSFRSYGRAALPAPGARRPSFSGRGACRSSFSGPGARRPSFSRSGRAPAVRSPFFRPGACLCVCLPEWLRGWTQVPQVSNPRGFKSPCRAVLTKNEFSLETSPKTSALAPV